MNALLLLLLDSRAPAGAHHHSGGMEAAVATGLVTDLTGLEGFCRAKLRTSARAGAAFVNAEQRSAALGLPAATFGLAARGELDAEQARPEATCAAGIISRELDQAERSVHAADDNGPACAVAMVQPTPSPTAAGSGRTERRRSRCAARCPREDKRRPRDSIAGACFVRNRHCERRITLRMAAGLRSWAAVRRLTTRLLLACLGVWLLVRCLRRPAGAGRAGVAAAICSGAAREWDS